MSFLMWAGIIAVGLLVFRQMCRMWVFILARERYGIACREHGMDWWIFIPSDKTSRQILKKYIDVVNKELVHPKFARFGRCRRYTWFLGGYLVPQPAYHAVYEAVMHDNEAPQCITSIARNGPMKGYRFTDTPGMR